MIRHRIIGTPDNTERALTKCLTRSDPNDVLNTWIIENMPSVLDLGCGYPKDLQLLNHKFGLENLVGVDKRTEKEILGHTTTPPITELTSLYEGYNRHQTINPGYRISNKYNEVVYNAIIKDKILFETTIGKYFANNPEKSFGIIIVSNVLQFLPFEVFERTLSLIGKVLSPGGKFYIRIQNNSGSIPWTGNVSKIDRALDRCSLVGDTIRINKKGRFHCMEFTNIF